MKAITKNLFRSLSIVSGLIASLNFAHGQMLAQSASADSVVQVVADAEGLTILSPEDVPLYGGTYWTVFPGLNGTPVPMPCLPMDSNVRVWAIADGQYLVDASGDVLPQATERMAARGVSSATLIQSQADAVDNLVLQVQANQQMQMMAMDVPTPGDGSGDGGTNSYTPDYSSYTVDYGSNLWVSGISLLSGNLNGTATNTQSGVQYDVMSRTNLMQTDWQYEGTILGSDATNWTPLSVSQNGRSSLFLRLRSNAGDGSGLPSWWQMQYFGVASGVNPNAQDPAGDGWSNWQKFKMGLNPNVFYTPPSPQGVTVLNNMAAKQATIQWRSSPGPVTGYTVEKTDANASTVQDFNVGTTSYQDDISGNSPGQYGGNNYQVSYRVQAHYSSGGTSAWSASVPLQQAALSGSIVPGTNGATFLLVSGLPKTAAAVRLVYYDWYAVQYHNDFSFNTYRDIPVSAFTNGAALLLASWQSSGVDVYGYNNTADQIQSIDSNGNASAVSWLSFVKWNQPFYDGRVQLKQNLIFLLREPNEITPFACAIFDTNGQETASLSMPSAYACAGYYDFSTYYGVVPELDALRPFIDNYFYRNFVFTTGDVDVDGNMTTGVSGNDYWDNNPCLTLQEPATYQFQSSMTNQTPISALLGTTQTPWLCSYPMSPPFSDGSIDYGMEPIGITFVWGDGLNEITYTLTNNARNFFGLPFLSVNIAYQSYDANFNPTGTLETQPLSPGSSFTVRGWNLYTKTAQPQFQTVEHDFWNPNFDTLPGMTNFSTSAMSRMMVAGVGTSGLQAAGYAKLAVLNGYSGVYGYLQQYFDQAYTENANGIATTNSAGILSPYGYFFPTYPGQAALVTMPDIDTGARGTGVVQVISLALNKSGDGKMNLSFNGPDATSASSPYLMWANQNFDRWATNKSPLAGYLYTDIEQDDQQIAFSPATPIIPTPDCNYSNVLANGYAYRAIPCTRDLEDFARLWVCGITTNLLAALPPGSTITLSWANNWNLWPADPQSANPTIDLFTAADADGGIGYLTNETVATIQTNIFQCPYIGRLGPGQSIQLNTIQFANNWAGNHFIWCGVSNGTGGLNLTIADGNGNVLAQTTAYIQIVDIKQMYERWTVGDIPTNAPVAVPYLVSDNSPAGMLTFQYTRPTDTNTPYILHVHGFNMETWVKDRFAETEFKRFYWQGYQGRFGSFRWPTTSTPPFYTKFFDDSESNAWASAKGLLNLLTNLNAEYPGHVYMTAHSHGTVVAGEALRQATQQGLGQIVNTYVAMQGAIAAHAYDPTTPVRSLGIFDSGTPNRYAHYYTDGSPCYFNGSAGAGTYVNFFNTNDWALTVTWQADQNTKPDSGYGYNPVPGFFYRGDETTVLTFPTNTYELFSYCDEARCYALGAQANVGGAFLTGTNYNQVPLPDVWPPDLLNNAYGDHIWHSAEFRSDNPQRWQSWNAVLTKMKLK